MYILASAKAFKNAAVLVRGYSTRNIFCEKIWAKGICMKNAILATTIAFFGCGMFVGGFVLGRQTEGKPFQTPAVTEQVDGSVEYTGGLTKTAAYEGYYTPSE